MNPTSIENKPRIYEVPTLLVKPQRADITPINVPENYYFQYIFNFNLNNVIDTSSCNLYPLTRKLTSSGTISYNSRSVYLNGSSYLSRDIDFDLKTLSFFFKLENVNDNYLLSTVDNDFYIKVNSNILSIKVNTVINITNITNVFIADNWYHLALTYNNELKKYDIYSNNSILSEKIDNLITNPITLNIGKKSGVCDNDGNSSIITTNPSSSVSVSGRKAHSMVAIGDNIYIFGGYSGGGYTYLNDFYKIDTTTFAVTKINLVGNAITARHSHSMVAIGDNIYIFGGYSGGGYTYLNDFYKIDTNTISTDASDSLSVSVEEITITGISGRFKHSMVVIGNNIYIYGGVNDVKFFDDFYKIDTTTFVVTKINFSDGDITGRNSHSMVAIGYNIYIYGGENGNFLNDFYKIDTNTISTDASDSLSVSVSVEEITITGISGRYGHSMVAIETDIYIYGGSVDTNYIESDLYKIDTVGYTTTQINFSGTKPAVKFHSMVEIDGNIYIFGGVYDDSSYNSDFYKITGDSYFTGNIADLRLYNYSITLQEIQDIKLPEPTIYIQYDFNNTLDKSSSSIYDDSLTLTSNGDIQYYLSPISVYLNGSSYLSTDIDFDLKTLSFWFKLKNVNDNYLLSFDNDFYIKVNSTSLEIQNDSSCNIETSFNSNIWYNLVLNYNNTDYDIYLSNIKLPETIDYKELTSFTLNIGKYSNIGHFTGNIADLRLYNHSITAEEITTIYNDSVNSMEDIIHTKTFSGTIPGDTNMLDDVPEETTILNIVIDSEAILYNENYLEGSGLYINFNKPNLRYVGQVNITNNGKIYGRGGIGKTSSTDNDYIGKYAIKVLSDDSITRIINISNIDGGEILGGGDGGDFIENHEITFTESEYVVRKIQWKQFFDWFYFEHDIPSSINGSETQYEGVTKTYNYNLTIPGRNADYFGINPENGTYSVISSSSYYSTDFTIPTGVLRTNQIIPYTDAETQYEFGFISKWWRYEYTYTYTINTINTETTSHTIEEGIHYYTKDINTGVQGFDIKKDIEVPNSLITVNKIS